jgi:hypothetical protein
MVKSVGEERRRREGEIDVCEIIPDPYIYMIP